MAYIITIGRQFGSGGRYVAQELAKRLGIAFYDSELIDEVSKESGLCADYIKDNEEKKDSIFAYVGLTEGSNFLTASQRVSIAQFQAIKKIAEKGESCIFVGRCADYVLKDYKNLASVFITAPVEDRIARAVKYYNIPEDKADNIIKKMDKKRAGYYNYFTDRKWSHAYCYDLCINSSIGIAESVDVIFEFVKVKFKGQIK